MANGVITWNGVASNTLGITVRKVPGLNRPQRKHDSYSVPGRNGNIVVMQDAFEEYEQEYEIFTLDNAQADAREIVDWLYQDGYCKLTDDWEPGYYRLAYFVGPLDVETILEEAAVCTIKFRCRPERYLVGQEKGPYYNIGSTTVLNPTNHDAHPFIRLYGSGARSMLNLSRTAGQPTHDPYYSAYINDMVPTKDTSYWITRSSGNSSIYVSGSSKATVSTITNTNGALEFTVTSAAQSEDWGVGIVYDVQGDADYTLSCEAYGGGYLQIMFANKSGSNELIKTARKEVTGSGWRPMSIAVHTPPECGYLLIIFTRKSTHSTAIQRYRYIMLNQGTEALTFREYNSAASSLLKFGPQVYGSYTKLIEPMQMTIAGTFDVVEIDCERENVTMDGVNANRSVTLTDGDGNISADYLKFESQAATLITPSGEISGIFIDPKFWEL